MLAPRFRLLPLTSPMLKNTSTKVKKDSLTDFRLAEFLSDENRYRQQLPAAARAVLVTTVSMIIVFLLF